ncbi:MAG: hypothetical protein GC159_01290 [Phycisphaera sp.]|nr:hypothetical protein [Phycisphaera sp.]
MLKRTPPRGAIALGLSLLIVVASAGLAADGAAEQIDFNKAKQLLQKQRAGEKLTAEEQAYLQRAREARQNRNRPQTDNATRPNTTGKTTIGIKPLTEMSADDQYKGFDGGLYGQGRNAPPAEQLSHAMAASARIQPLDADGKPSPDGKIVLVSVGMSNTTQEFTAFIRIANPDADRNPKLVIVDGAQGGQEASDWADPENRYRKEKPSTWDVLDQRLSQAGVTWRQVQAIWMLQARRKPADLGAFPKHAQVLKENQVAILNLFAAKAPNLQLAYLSSRAYGGYASTDLNPEPYAFEGAFANRWIIEDQMSGKADAVQRPVVLWGPYLWADGMTGRRGDGLKYERADFVGDGTHPSDSGRSKVAQMLLTFFKTDATARTWFTKGDAPTDK